MTLRELLALPRDGMLTGVAAEIQPQGFIADLLMPVVPVALEQGGYYTFDMTNFNIPEALRAPRTVYKEIDFGLSSDTYRAEEYGLEARIDARERRNAPGALDLDVSKTRRLTNAILLNRERRIANLVTNTANVTQNTTLVGAAQWSDPSSNPLTQAIAARTAMRNAIGMTPNTLTMSYVVREALRAHPALIDFVDGGRPTDQDLADFFEVERVLVAGARYNTAREGQAATLGDLWGKDALFTFTSPVAAAEEPSFGYQFQAAALAVFRYADVPVSSEVIRVNEIRAEKIVAPTAGYLVKAAVA